MELRLEVAKFLGWKLWRDVTRRPSAVFIEPPAWRPANRFVASHTHNIIEAGDDIPLYADALDDVPDWPNDDALAACTILPEIIRRGWHYEISSQVGGEIACKIGLDIASTHEDISIAATFSMAVCLAFIHACKEAKS